MISEQFLEFENKKRLFEDSIEGFQYWPYIRFEVYTWTSSNVQRKYDEKSKRKNLQDKAKGVIWKFWLALSHNTFKCHKHVDVLAMGYPRWIKNQNGVLLDPYVEYLTKHLTWSSQVIERYLPAYKNYDSKTGYRVYTEDAELISKIRAYFLSKKKKRLIFNKCKTISDYIKDEFGIDIDINLIMRKMIKSYTMWITYRKKYQKLLIRTTPFCILEAPGYSDSSQIMNEIAKEMSIPTIEIEHGWISENNIPYNYIDEINIKSFPEHIFVCSEYQKTNVRFPIPSENIHVVGFPFLEEQVEVNKLKNKNTILLLGNVMYLGDAINKFAIRLVKYIKDSSIDYKVVFKAHPKDPCQSCDYDKLRENSDIVEIVSGTHDKSVYDCLGNASIVIGTSTSTLYEAKAFGGRVYILRAPDSEIMKNFVEQGYSIFINNPEDIFHNHTENLKKDLWPLNALEKSIIEISNIIEKQKKRVNDEENNITNK